MLRSYIDRCLHGRVPNLQIEITRRWQSQLRLQSQSQSAYDHFEEMVMATVRIEEHVQTMCRPAAAVGLLGQIVRQVHSQGED